MKTCVITSLYNPYSKYGAERIAENIVNGLVEKGNEVIIITTKPCYGTANTDNNDKHPGCDSASGPSHDHIKVIRFYPCNLFWFGNINKKPAWLRLPWHIIDVFNIHTYFKIKKILKAEKPDLIMTHNLKGIGYTVPAAISSAEIRHIHTAHDVQLVEPSGLILNVDTRRGASLQMWLKKIYVLINKKLFGSPEIVISPSEWLMNFYTKKGFFKNSKKIILKNPIQKIPPLVKGDKGGFSKSNLFYENAPPLYKGGIEPALSMPKWGVKNTLNLLYVGQIEKHKGILLLINAVKNLENISLDIIGAGSQTDKIKQMAEGCKNIKIHGFIKHNLLNTFFAQTDFLIVPSICYENAPTVIYESFSNGVPVIASNIGGIPELVKNRYNGYIYEAGNEQSLLDTFKKCADEKEKWENLKCNALNSVKELGIGEYIDRVMLEIEKLNDE